MSQKTEILAHLRETGVITPMEALRKFHCLRLADIIYELRKEGWKITESHEEGYGRYRLTEGLNF